jgi:hypothetical protein
LKRLAARLGLPNGTHDLRDNLPKLGGVMENCSIFEGFLA